ALLLLVEPWNVVVGNFFHRVQRNHVPQVHGRTVSLQAVCDALQLLLIFDLNMRPQNVLRSLAVEIPFALGAMYVLELNGPESVLDFGREQISVLIANIGGRSLEMDIQPTVALETIGRLQTRLVGLVRILLSEAESRAAQQHTDGEPEPNQRVMTEAHATPPRSCRHERTDYRFARRIATNASGCWMAHEKLSRQCRSFCRIIRRNGSEPIVVLAGAGHACALLRRALSASHHRSIRNGRLGERRLSRERRATRGSFRGAAEEGRSAPVRHPQGERRRLALSH